MITLLITTSTFGTRIQTPGSMHSKPQFTTERLVKQTCNSLSSSKFSEVGVLRKERGKKEKKTGQRASHGEVTDTLFWGAERT
jgi:hypothetical protein